MAIYARRVIQEILNRSDAFLDDGQTSFFVRQLNLPSKECLAFEWELVMLNALSHLGSVSYEKDLGGSSRPDICFVPEGDSQSLVADISIVSDSGFHDENPYDDFVKEFKRVLDKYSLELGGFSVRCEGDFVGKYEKLQMKMLIPRKNEIPQFIKSRLMAFILEVKNNPSQSNFIKIEDKSVNMEIEYNPSKRGVFGGGYPSYTSIYSKEKNPIINKLKSKSIQLKKCGTEGVKGIFICDGDCAVLREGSQMGSAMTAGEIIEYYFRRNASLSFVLAVSVQERHKTFGGTERSNSVVLYENEYAGYKLSEVARNALKSIIKHLPEPIVNAKNALNYVGSGKDRFGQSFHGGYTLNDNRIKMSARELLEILSGNQKTVSNMDKRLNQRFSQMLNSGKTIAEVTVEKVRDKDDDWVVLEFENDPAISQYVDRA